MNKELFNRANEVVMARAVWEQKQRLWYEMRHEGIRRRQKPWPSASDLHFPLIDMNIRKAKPFYEAQALSAEFLASFVSLKEQQQPITSAAAEWFDFELKQNSNFNPELVRGIDMMLWKGRGVLKATVDPFQDYKLVFEAVDPLFILMADGADDFEDADFFVHVMHLTVGQYERNRRYAQDRDLINRIKGAKDLDLTTYIERLKELREGVNFSRNPRQIILWEHYEKTMAGWTVHTYSPHSPEDTIRKPFQVPYKFRGKTTCPFVSFRTEIKDKGWYACRGLAELNAGFESYATKLWNEKVDAMTLSTRPVFTSDQQIPNIANIRWHPGEFIPGNIKQVPMQPVSFSFDQEIAFARSIGEQLSMLPDFGITQPNDKGGNSPRTATENNRIANLQTVGTDSNGRIFRNDLAKLYRHVWGMMLQFKAKEISYYAAGQIKTVPEQALHDEYLITPDGSPDQWNKQQKLQHAMMRLQTFRGSQNVDQDVLVRDVLAADDPKFALEAFIPTNVKAGSEAEDEAVEIAIMVEGFPAQVKPDEDHMTRIHVLLGWLEKQILTRAPVDPIARQRIQEHLMVHFMYLKKMQPQAAQQVAQQVLLLERSSMQSGAAAQPPGAGPPGGGPAGAPPGPGGGM